MDSVLGLSPLFNAIYFSRIKVGSECCWQKWQPICIFTGFWESRYVSSLCSFSLDLISPFHFRKKFLQSPSPPAPALECAWHAECSEVMGVVFALQWPRTLLECRTGAEMSIFSRLTSRGGVCVSERAVAVRGFLQEGAAPGWRWLQALAARPCFFPLCHNVTRSSLCSQKHRIV